MTPLRPLLALSFSIGLVNSTNVTFVDEVSGILGLSFPRLSTIEHSAANGMPLRQLAIIS